MIALLAKHARLIFIWGALIALLSAGISLLFPRQYSAESQVLIISRDRSGVDPYTQAKSAERIGDNLAQVMKTADFYSKVIEASGAKFDRARWDKLAERQRRRRWQRDVRPEMMYSTSLLKITVYSNTPDDTAALAGAVTQTLVSRGWEYVGGDVALKEVSSPLVSRWQTRPNVPLNAVIGFLVGILLAGLWVARYKQHTIFGKS